ncbi:hypothetical protein GCM10008015_27850 [Flavobacterium palustre]|uniref:Type ISP restriction-modification enzyme LLaBIII C-terminal specificity domain-containing protein n=1 Tax=Flavobacterium palustre TaxID=1476463 RepID=A0ABQ1HRG1_9FLAO|nr:type ISP restriction/modification enzyme [Flavobacterium palustre]GGA85546.1 hypothetical protein GCM10008015_27850 [Flavobacterium palustre]
MDAAVLKTIEEIIKIPFVEEEFEVGAVCFETDEDLRPDFKLQFTIDDVVNYIYAIVFRLYSKENTKNLSILDLKIPYPKNAASFWEDSSIGKKFRQQQIIKELEFTAVSQLNWESI